MREPDTTAYASRMMVAYTVGSLETTVLIHPDIYEEASVVYRLLTGRNESDFLVEERKDEEMAEIALSALGVPSAPLLAANQLYAGNPAVQNLIFLAIAKGFYGAEPGVPKKIAELDKLQQTLDLPDDLVERIRQA